MHLKQKWLNFIFILLTITFIDAVYAMAAPHRCDIYKVPKYDGFKSYERGILENGEYIFDKDSRQYELQKIAKSTKTGFRRVDGRYLIAVGSRFTDRIGQYITLVLKNGKEIPCIVGDLKADKDTDESNTFSENGCCSEFIVDIRKLDKSLRNGGDISKYRKSWNSPVSVIIVQDQNAFDDKSLFSDNKKSTK